MLELARVDRVKSNDAGLSGGLIALHVQESSPSMRPLIAVMLLALAGCGAYPHYSDPRLATKINDQYALRDACLAKNAEANLNSSSSASEIARTISLSCQAETDSLIAVSNPYNDPRISAAIERDTQFRATGYVLRARNLGTPN